MGTKTLTYDAADRNTSVTNNSSTVSYGRDATNRIVERSVVGSVEARYGFTGPGDSPTVTYDGAGNVTERVLGLIGGATLTVRGGGAAVWSYPNIHGDVVATANSAGGAGLLPRMLTSYTPSPWSTTRSARRCPASPTTRGAPSTTGPW